MSSDHNGHDSKHENAGHIIDEKSVQDKLLSLLAVLTLVGLLALGFYWQSLPLPEVDADEESSKETGLFPNTILPAPSNSTGPHHYLQEPFVVDERSNPASTK